MQPIFLIHNSHFAIMVIYLYIQLIYIAIILKCCFLSNINPKTCALCPHTCALIKKAATPCATAPHPKLSSISSTVN